MDGRGELSEQYYDFVFQPVKEGETVESILITALNVTHQVQARKAVLEREAYFREMADSVPVMIWVTRSDGYCTYLNKPWYDYTGQTEEEALGSGWLKATHPADFSRSQQAFLSANARQGPFSILYRLKGKDGTYRWFLDKADPKFDPAGNFEGYIGVVIDVDEQQRAEQRLQLSVRAGRVGIFEWDVVHDRATYSDLLQDMFGLEPGRFQGEFENAYQVYQRIIYPKDRDQVNEQVAKAFSNRATEFYVEFRVVKPAGEVAWIAERGEILYEGSKPQRMNGTCIDITERKQAEEARQRMAEELAALNEELSAANEEIQAANEELSQSNGKLTLINADLDNFIYTASHDLKAPILNIEGLMKVLSRRISKLSGQDEQLEKMFTLMEDSVIRFKETINDLTDVARIGKQLDQESESVDLLEVVEATLLDLQQPVDESGAQIESRLEACPSIVFPRKNLKSIVYNLLSNAIKYRDPNRTPHITLTCQPDRNYLVLQVQDNGLGMDTSNPDKIFGMFKRLHAHVEGTGIGLYIVKKMIENAGGKIEVESTVGQGSTFRVYFKRSGGLYTNFTISFRIG